MEHLHHFHLTDDPFRNEPRLRIFFESRQHGEALRRLERGARQGKGLSVLVGEAGSGKTMVVRRLLECLEEEVFEASMIVVLRGAADPGWVMERFAIQLGIEEPAGERKTLLAQIYEQLAIVREDGRHAVLIIDDAEALGESLAELCGLLKLEYEERRLLSLVLAGSPALERVLGADPNLLHGVDVKVQIHPFDAEAAAAYLAHRVKSAGGSPTLLDAGAVAALHALGRGLAGRMNTLADNALFEAFLCGREQVTRTDVERACRDLGWEAAAGDPPAAEPAALEGPLGDLDSELEEVFATAASAGEPERVAVTEASPQPTPIGVAAAPPGVPRSGPPKEDDEEDLFVELLAEE